MHIRIIATVACIIVVVAAEVIVVVEEKVTAVVAKVVEVYLSKHNKPLIRKNGKGRICILCKCRNLEAKLYHVRVGIRQWLSHQAEGTPPWLGCLAGGDTPMAEPSSRRYAPMVVLSSRWGYANG